MKHEGEGREGPRGAMRAGPVQRIQPANQGVAANGGAVALPPSVAREPRPAASSAPRVLPPSAAREPRSAASSAARAALPRAAFLVAVLASCTPPAPAPAVAPAPAPASAVASAPASASAPAAAAAPAVASAPLAPSPPPPFTDGAPPPPVHPLDPKAKAESALLLAATPTSLWLAAIDGGTVVVDRKTGCATESYVNPTAAVARLKAATREDLIDAALTRPDVVADLREVIGLGRRFGATTHPYFWSLVWSPDGRYVFLETDPEHLYRSEDGARTFKRVDTHRSGRLEMAPDGRHLVYERCVHDHCPKCSSPGCAADRVWVSVPTDASAPPIEIAGGHPLFLEWKDATHARFSVDGGAAACLLTVDVEDPTQRTTACSPIQLTPGGPAPFPRWEAVSPNGMFGIVTYNVFRKNLAGVPALTQLLALVDATSGLVLKTVTDMRGEVDDAGNMVLSAMAEGGGDHTYFYPRSGPRRLLGHQSLVTWADRRVAILAPFTRGALGAHRCKLVKLVPTP